MYPISTYVGGQAGIQLHRNGLRDIEFRDFSRPTGRTLLLGRHECRAAMPTLVNDVLIVS